MSYSSRLEAFRELHQNVNTSKDRGDDARGKEGCLAASSLLMTSEAQGLDQARQGARLVLQWVVSLLHRRKNKTEDEEKMKRRILIVMDEKVWTVSICASLIYHYLHLFDVYNKLYMASCASTLQVCRQALTSTASSYDRSSSSKDDDYDAPPLSAGTVDTHTKGPFFCGCIFAHPPMHRLILGVGSKLAGCYHRDHPRKSII